VVCRYSLFERAIAEKVVLLDVFSAHTTKTSATLPTSLVRRRIVAVGTPVDPTPPAQIRTCRIAAYGSYLG
jgi:hypothetical protein